MLTRRQKNSIRGMTAALTCSALLAGFLIYTNISNAETPEPVVFSDILEGAVAYSDGDDIPAVTLASEQLMETMFSEQYAALFDPNDPAYAVTYISPAYSGTDTSSPTVEGSTEEQPADLTDDTGIPGNANEMTLLSDELEGLRSEGSVSSSTSYSGNAYIYIHASDSSSVTPQAADENNVSDDTTDMPEDDSVPATYEDPYNTL